MQLEYAVASKRAILAWCGPLNHRLGRFIVSSGDLFDLRRRGSTIEGSCREIANPPWKATAQIHGGNIREAACTCALGETGQCPHVAAILLACEADPARFIAARPPNFPLESRSKSELIEIINQMRVRSSGLEVQPGLDPGDRFWADDGLDLPTLRLYASSAFMIWECDYETAVRVARELERSLERGDGHLAQREYRHAIMAHSAVALAILDYSEVVTVLVDQDDGELRAALAHAISGLAAAIAGADAETPIRKFALRTLFNAHMEDVNYGGCMFGEKAGALLAEHASTAERALLTSWIRAGMPPDSTWPDHVRRQLRGRYLLQLGRQDLDEEATLEICRESGLAAELADRLLSAGRLDAALAGLELAWGSELPGIGEVFRRHGFTDLILPFLDQQFESQPSRDLAGWLKRTHLERGEDRQALPAAEYLFEREPEVMEYLEFRDLAVKAGAWGRELRRRLIGSMSSADVDLIAGLYMEGGEIEPAIEIAEFQDLGTWNLEPLIRAAEAIADSNPGAAAAHFHHLAEICIRRRGRQRYQQACRLLIRTRVLLRDSDRAADWQRLIDDLRQRNDSLPALQDELNRFGL